MNDSKLAPLWRGDPLPDEVIVEAKQKWPNDATLIDMQEGTDLLREAKLTPDEQKRAEGYLESAYNTFEDLRDPENFSKAFTADNQTPYRGRPYERMLAAILVALLDASRGRCDMAIPALKSAEFLDARWQPFMFGSDAPMVYALLLRCLNETKASPSDVERASDGLLRAVRMQLLLEPLLAEVEWYAKQSTKEPAKQIALSLIEVGIPSALLAAPSNADIDELAQMASAESMGFLPRALKENEAPYADIVRPLLKKIDTQSKGSEMGANATFQIEVAFKDMWKEILSHQQFKQTASDLLEQAHSLRKRIESAVRKPVMVVYFDGDGPRVKQEGQYNEIARIVPSSPANARAGVPEKILNITPSCGVSNHKGNLIVTLCRSGDSTKEFHGESTALKLWASSFQATTTAGRKFDLILKGRAQFRMGTEVAALIGAYTALALLNISSGLRGQQAAQVQTAALVVGAVAGAAWLAGRATNPEADTRQVMYNFESGYLLLP